MTDQLHRWENLGHCPDCGCGEFEPGPRGVGCGAWWNTVVELGLIQRIREDEPKRPGRPVTAEHRKAWPATVPDEEWEKWVLAPSALNYQQAMDWAIAAGGCKIICLSSGETLVRIDIG